MKCYLFSSCSVPVSKHLSKNSSDLPPQKITACKIVVASFSEHPPPGQQLTYTDGHAGGGPGTLRRSLSQSCRPPPPVRRHSSISAAARCWRPQGSVSEAVRSLNAAQHRPASPAGRAAAPPALRHLGSFSVSGDAAARERRVLMDQIRGGATLKQTVTVQDSSAPLFRS